MNITLVKLRGVVRELSGIRKELSRLVACWERELQLKGVLMQPIARDESEEENSIEYTDEELDWARDMVEQDKISRGMKVERPE